MAIKLFSNIGLTDANTGGQTSSVGEPSVGKSGSEVFLSGNWYTTKSLDAGQTWHFIDPYHILPPVAGGFCCTTRRGTSLSGCCSTCVTTRAPTSCAWRSRRPARWTRTPGGGGTSRRRRRIRRGRESGSTFPTSSCRRTISTSRPTRSPARPGDGRSCSGYRCRRWPIEASFSTAIGTPRSISRSDVCAGQAA